MYGCLWLCVCIQDLLAQPDLKHADRKQLEKEMKKREEVIKPLYHQATVMFADLHDTAWRMQDKGCINVSAH